MAISSSASSVSNSASYKDGKVKKSRNRIPTSCSVCRRRKMKCDRAKPHCGSCIANETIDICSYSQQPWEYLSTEKQLSNEVLRLKLKINELERSLNRQQIVSPPDSLSTTYSSSNEVEDPLIELGIRFDKLIIKHNSLVHYGTTSYLGLQANDPVLIAMYRKYFVIHQQKYHEQIAQKSKGATTTPKNIVEEKKQIMDDAFCWSEKPNTKLPSGALIHTGDTLDEMVAAVNAVLPDHEIVILLLEHFFEKGYPLFPFIDESIFKEDLSLILTKSAEGKAIFKCSVPSQLVVISLALILLRIAYLILPLEDYYMDQNRIKNDNTLKLCASEVNIPASFVNHARYCLFHLPGPDNMMTKVTLMNIQVLLFLKVYRAYAPEDGDEGGESSIHMAMVIQMCRMQGIYRDPEMFQDVVSDHRLRHLWRKIWYKLLALDAIMAIHLGAPLTVNDDQWDCALPSLGYADKAYLESFNDSSTRKSNLAFDPVKYDRLYGEQQIIEGYKIEYKATCVLREVAQLSHNMKNTPRTSDFLKMIKKIENCLNLEMESFYDLVTDPKNDIIHHQVLNIKKFQAKCLLLLVRYILSYLLLLASDDEDDINNNFNNLYSEDNEQLVKTTESSLQLFKISYDFLVFETEDELSCSDPKLYLRTKRFYGCYDKLLASDILLGGQRALQFLSSITIRYGTNFYSFSSLIRNFANSQDAVEILSWFNMSVHNMTTNVDVSLDKKFSIMLYQYIKVFYTKCLLLKDKYFHCLRMNMLIKLFINHLKTNYAESYEELNSDYTFDKTDELNQQNTVNIQQLENAKEFRIDEDLLMSDLANMDEDEMLKQIFNDERLSRHTLVAEDEVPKTDNIDNLFSPSYMDGNYVMSPMNQLNDLLSFNKGADSGNGNV